MAVTFLKERVREEVKKDLERIKEELTDIASIIGCVEHSCVSNLYQAESLIDDYIHDYILTKEEKEQ